MKVSTYSEKYGYAVSYFNLSTALVLMECRSVTHHVKKVLLYTTIQLPRYIKININSTYYCSMIDGYSMLD